MGIYWQRVDFDEDDIEPMMDELYEELLPFYKQLHAYVRKKLKLIYKGIDPEGPIPAHLQGAFDYSIRTGFSLDSSAHCS